MAKSNRLKLFRPDVGRDNESNRHAWLAQTLARVPAGGRILDAGAGTQQYKRFCQHLEYVSQDFAQYNGQGDARGLQTGSFEYGKLDIVSDITAIPESDASFDAVMCTEVLEHVPDPPRALAELCRLLKPGGQMILTAPFCSLTHFSPYHFSTGFNRYFYETLLDQHGIDIQEMTPNGNYFEYMAQEVRRIRSAAKSFTSSKPRLGERLAMMLVNRMLARFSKLDEGSSELCCYGYHVVAQKRSASVRKAA